MKSLSKSLENKVKMEEGKATNGTHPVSSVEDGGDNASISKSSIPGANVIKLFTAQCTNFCNKLRVFILGRLFQFSLMFVGKARSLP